MPHHDIVIIGTGSGNSLVTPELEGLDIAIIEEGRFGGTCLNVGCIPTKMFVVPADRVAEAADAARLGVTFAEPTIDWPAIRDRVFGRIDPIADGGEAYRRSQDFVTVYDQHARFVGERTLRLADGTEVSGDLVVVAAGSRARALPDVPGLERIDPERGLHTSDTIMRLEALPPRMLVLGGGFVACEFVHVFASFGVAVTQVQRSDVLLTGEERVVSEAVTAMARRRSDLRTSTRPRLAERVGDVWRVTVEDGDGQTEVLEAEVVLLAVGRAPNGDRLDAEQAGIELDAEGLVVVDSEQRTTAPRTWALGDVCSPWQLKHVANHEARVVAHNLAVALGKLDAPPQHSDHRFVPHAVFSYPQVASFGPTAVQLEAADVPFVTTTQSYGDVAYGWALEDQEGFLTVHASPDGQILAAHCVGMMASTVIQPLIQAASFGQHAHEVARGQYWIHPALAEVVENALLGLRVSAPDGTTGS
ncbi:mycothione reductase [Pseudactinotalea suaedae]|uniref:mycothione reductase n=1 Tax=Pseudactinotalea suaedae TaxID=1524924 RepID=UPI0012E1700C|nr:mycothione reductase [Pseudactinotalea suaedae]